MIITRRGFVGLGATAATLLAACGSKETEAQTDATPSTQKTASKTASNLTLDSSAWRHDAENDVYYQLGISYCENPADDAYEQLAILVPGAYFTATDNGNDTFTCQVNEAGKVGAYTALTAPIVMPVNTPGYSAQSPMSEYRAQTTYTGAGMVYVHAGCRGRDTGAPAGIVDLKAAVRYLRLVKDQVAGNVDRIFTFGMSGGGAQSALMGATGDSELYEPYLQAIGAAGGVSDAVFGSMDWCPITGLDVGDEAYEWMMGCTRSDLSEDEKGISDGLAESYAAWVNEAGICDEDGNPLTLTDTDDGISQGGTYYDRVRLAIEESLNNFLADTEFPYDASSSKGMMGGGPGGGGAGGNMGEGRPEGMPDGERPEGMPDGEMPNGGFRGKRGEGRPDGMPDDAAAGEQTDAQAPADAAATGATAADSAASGAPTGEQPDGQAATDAQAPADATDAQSPADATGTDAASNMPAAGQHDGIARNEAAAGISLSGTYETAMDYIAALNADKEWVSYDEATNTATISSVADFCTALKPASKSLGAFDQLDRGQGENTLFGTDGSASHFDNRMAQVLSDLGSSYAADYKDDLAHTDALGTDVATRVAMYTPLYYLLESEKGYGQSEPAKHWRIRTGIEQGDTALTTELNLALALKADARVESVDFATVWGQGHTQAERTGSADQNFVAWVADCLS